MVNNTKIEWSESVWNPVTGCTKISTGCKHCYAEKMTRRLQAMGQEKYANGFEVTLHPEVLEKPLMWRKSRRIFVNSMSDLFHEKVPVKFIKKVFKVMRKAEHHQFQVLTKRSERLAELAPDLPWADNIWMGVTVETKGFLQRIAHLQETEAAIKFISFEPLLGPVSDFNPTGIDWVIVGGESGPGARPMDTEWATEIRDTCLAAGVAFFFKQWGGRNKKAAGCLLDGRIWNEYPT
jgi:protein gp37